MKNSESFKESGNMTNSQARSIPGYFDQINQNSIIEIIQKHTGVSMDDARSKCRKHQYVLFRRLYWFFMSTYQPCTYVALGATLNRDHSTVSQAINSCNNRFDYELRNSIAEVERMIEKRKQEVIGCQQ